MSGNKITFKSDGTKVSAIDMRLRGSQFLPTNFRAVHGHAKTATLKKGNIDICGIL